MLAPRRLVLTVLCVLGGLVSVLTVGGPGAAAAVTHPVVGSFGVDGAGLTKFAAPQTIAVDESTGDVFVYDGGTDSIYKFDANGKPVEFSALKTNAIASISGYSGLTQIAVDGSSGPAKGDIYVATAFALKVYAPNGELIGELGEDGHPNNSGLVCGVAVDPSGYVYVARYGYVNKYAPKASMVTGGDYVSTLYANDETCFIAVDPSGDVLTLPIFGGAVKEYLAGEFNVLGTPGIGAVMDGSGESMALDSASGDVYVDNGSLVAQYDSAGSEIGVSAGFEGSNGVGMDDGTGKLYVSDGEAGLVDILGLAVLVPTDTIEPASNIGTTTATVAGTVDPEGRPVAKCAFEYGTGGKFDHSVPCPVDPGSGSGPVSETVELTGLEPNQTYGVRLAASGTEGTNNFTRTSFTLNGPPTLGGLSLGATKTALTMEDSITSHGYDTTYHFEVGTTTSYGTVVPVPDGDVGVTSGTGISASVPGLTPGTEYHVRLVATNSAGTTDSPDQSVTTLPSAVVETESVTGLNMEEATLSTRIGPLGDDTTYHFEYGPTTSYGTSLPVPDIDIGAGSLGEEAGNRPVFSQRIAGLQPGTTYHYRAVARNALGTIHGEDRQFTTLSPPAVAQADTCPNAPHRINGPSEFLPDCRAYEMVSPLDKNGSDIGGRGDHAVRASVEGDRVAFIASSGFADTGGSGNTGATTYVGSRGSSGWSIHAVTPASPVTSYQELGKATTFLGFSSDLRSAFVYGVQLPGADPGTGGLNLYREELAGRGLETATLNTSGKPLCLSSYCWFEVAAGYASNDVGVIAFQTTEQMTQEATGGATTLYAWEHGTLHIAGVLPNGTLPVGGSESVRGAGGLFTAGPVAENESVSNDGSRILFVSPANGSSKPQLYMRKDGTSTVWLSRSWTSPPSSEPEGVAFQAATPDETRVLFTSRTPLLSSDPDNGEVGLYMYTDSPENAESEGKLSFVARLNGEASVTAVSNDASHIYIANPAPSPDLAERGEYLWDNGTLHHILRTPIARGGINYSSTDEVRVSDDGRRLGFLRAPNLATEPELAKPAPNQDVGADPRSPGYGYLAAYLYDEGTGSVTCVSCPPTGAAMTAPVHVLPEALLPGLIVPYGFPFSPHWLSGDGRFTFFSSTDALVPQDTNGLADVYEYDADTHEVKLLSSGTGESGSWFEDASASGSDVFFLTQQKLSGWDTDALTDLYDVRIDGGLPEPPPPATPCDGDACQGIPSPVPSFNTASGFAGLGNQSSGEVVKAKKKSKPKKPKKGKPKKEKPKKKRGKQGRKARRSVRHMSNRVGL